LYQLILAYPGVTFNVLKKVNNLNRSTLRYHLKYLEKAERIKSDLNNGQRSYYPLNDEILLSKIYGNKSKTNFLTVIQQQILSLIKKNPGITQKELIKKTSLSRFTISYNTRKFISMGLVKKTVDENNVHYEYISEEILKDEVLVRLTIKLLSKELDEDTYHHLRRRLE